MGKAIPTPHPAVVLRSHYTQLRALLAIAMIAVVGLTAAVVILATSDDRDTSTGAATQATAPGPTGTTRYDGGPEEGSRSVVAARQPAVRYDGGPEEGTAPLTQRSAPATFDPNSIKNAPGLRYDGGPEEGTRLALSPGPASNAAAGTRFDGGPEEGSRGLSARSIARARSRGERIDPRVMGRLEAQRRLARVVPAQQASTRYDGGPEEGSKGSRR